MRSRSSPSPTSAPPAATRPARSCRTRGSTADTKTLLADRGASNLDFVDIATPPCDHAAIAHAAFEHGLHVFCEKPIATSGADARSMLDHATAGQARVLPVAQLQARAGDQGDPRRARVAASSARSTSSRSTRSAPRTPRASPSGSPTGAAQRKTSGGGIAMDHGSHTFYLAFDWLGVAADRDHREDVEPVDVRHRGQLQLHRARSRPASRSRS